MAEPSTFIKLDRNIETWRWYHDGNTCRVFIHLLITANIEDHDFEKITIHRGEVATSYASLSKSLGISTRSVRTAIEHLKSTGEVTSRPYRRFQVISIVSYDKYQSYRQANRQPTDTLLTSNRQQLKNIRTKEVKNNNIADRPKEGGGPLEESVEISRDENGCDTRIPPMFRDSFKEYQDYMNWRYQ